MRNLLVLLVIVAVCLTTMSALQCYDCDLTIDTDCGYGRNDYRQMTCDDIIPEEIPETTTRRKGYKKNQPKKEMVVIVSACYKLIAEINGLNRTTRSCTELGGPVDPCNHTIYPFKVIFCQPCLEDLCNGVLYIEETTEYHRTYTDEGSNISLTKPLIIFASIICYLSTIFL